MAAGVLRELQRRNVIRAAILYVGGVWLLAQVIVTLGPVVGAPDWMARGFLIAAAIGFPFWVTFAWFYELTPEGIRRESEVDADKSVLKATGRRLDFLIIGVLAVAVVLLLTDRLLRHDEPPTSAPALIADKSVAVLPLVNESGDANALYFSDGLSEAFIDALSQFSGLKVIARASSFQFRNSRESVAIIGEKLGVAHLLEGSVQRADDAFYVFQFDGALMVKLIERLLDGRVALKSRNPSYREEVLSKEDAARLSVFGRVVWRGGLV